MPRNKTAVICCHTFDTLDVQICSSFQIKNLYLKSLSEPGKMTPLPSPFHLQVDIRL